MTPVYATNELISIIGGYNDAIMKILSSELLPLIRSPILWIEFQEIPIYYILTCLKDLPEILSKLYFLEIPDLYTFSKIFNVSELFLLKDQGFQTLIIHIPKFHRILPEEHVGITELAKGMNIFIITDEKLFSEMMCKNIRVGDNFI
ncbi:MAG: hypothetical protein EAX86_05760 [Candidatus Heimdallarchaeota archaeon]|nr:hypothetical protein [Candidatus Heimdallarchaeota archaeon]